MKRAFLLVYLIGFVIITAFYPNSIAYGSLERQTYLAIIFAYIVIGGCLTHAVCIRNMYFFEPILLISAMYLAVFVFMPIHDILANDTLQFGKYVMGGGVKATVILTVSYFALYIGYSYKLKIRNDRSNFKIIKFLEIPDNKIKIVEFVSTIIWIVSIVLYIIYIVTTRGLSLRYILTAGLSGEYNAELTMSSPLAFLNKFGNSLAVPFLYIWIFSDNKAKKIFILVFTLIIYFVNGSRYIMIIFLAGPLVYHYIKKKKSPSIFTVSLLLCILLITCAFIAVVRVGVRAGNSFDFSSFTLDDLFNPFYSNFTLYKTFYGVVEVFPKEYPYQLGRGMIFGTLILMIPRAIWHGKPQEAIVDYIKWGINVRASESGLAYNNIGEYYVEFGIIGCIFFMLLFGVVCRRMKDWYNSENRTTTSLVLYSVTYPLIFALINAGWTPANFYTVLFTVLPWFIVNQFLHE